MDFSFLHKKKEHNKGFTIIELVVSMTIFGVLIFLVAQLFITTFNGSKQQFLAVDNVEKARLTTSQFVNEIRNAKTGVDGSYSLGQASDAQIVFYSRAASSGSGVNRIRYYVNGTTLYKGVVVPSGVPPIYNLASESVKIVQNDLTNGALPIFTYYDGSYDGTTSALLQPVNVNLVKFVKINLVVLTQISQNNNTFSISTGATIRNVKNNLGN